MRSWPRQNKLSAICLIMLWAFFLIFIFCLFTLASIFVLLYVSGCFLKRGKHVELSEVGRTWEALEKGKVGLKYIACIFSLKTIKEFSSCDY